MHTSIPCEARIRLPSKASHHDSTRRFSPSIWTKRERTPRCAGPENLAGSNVELTAMARARHSSTVQLALRERARSVGTCVIEGMKLSRNIRNVHLGAGKIKHAHLSRNDIFCVSNSYQHNFDFPNNHLAATSSAAKGPILLWPSSLSPEPKL